MGGGGMVGGFGGASGGVSGDQGGTRGGNSAPPKPPGEPPPFALGGGDVSSTSNGLLETKPRPYSGPWSNPSQASMATTKGKKTANTCQFFCGFHRRTGPSIAWYVIIDKITEEKVAANLLEPWPRPIVHRKSTKVGQWKR